MDLYTSFTGIALAIMLLGVLAAAVSAGVLAEFVVTNRRARVARHESIRTYYHRQFALTH